MWCMWEHVYRLNGRDFIVCIKQSKVACLCCRVTTNVNNSLWTCSEYNVHNVRMHTCTWRVSDDNVWASMLVDEVFGQNVFHVTCIEKCVINLINLRVYFRILYSLWNIFYTNYFLSFLRYEVRNCTRTRIEVIYKFVTCKVGKFACNRIEVICLFGIGLVETLDPP